MQFFSIFAFHLRVTAKNPEQSRQNKKRLKMKDINFFFFLLSICILTFLTESCSPMDEDMCSAMECNTGTLNQETCTCDCPEGFSGTNCETEDFCVTQNVICENEGTCVDGTCECPEGYSGTSCEIEDRAQFIGDYNVSDFCDFGMSSYNISITDSSSTITEIIIENFSGIGVAVEATVSGDKLTIPSQEVFVPTPPQGTARIEGSGSISGTILSLTYSLADLGNGLTDNCESTCTKQ